MGSIDQIGENSKTLQTEQNSLGGSYKNGPNWSNRRKQQNVANWTK